MWNESGATVGDFTRVVALVRSQYVFRSLAVASYPYIKRVKIALRDESSRQWHEMESDFVDVEYRAVRDRQMKELEAEDDLLSKIPIRFVRHPCPLDAPLI